MEEIEQKTIPEELLCGACGSIFQRAVTITCCASTVCRACAVKKLMQDKTCWNGHSTGAEDLVNDYRTREKVNQYKKRTSDQGGSSTPSKKIKGETNAEAKPKCEINNDQTEDAGLENFRTEYARGMMDSSSEYVEDTASTEELSVKKECDKDTT